MSHTVFLDESGDLGFKFTHPYGNGGSSRFLTMAFFIVPNNKKDLLKRLVRKIYKKYKFDPSEEAKGSHLTNEQREYIANQILSLVRANPDIHICSITVRKDKVTEAMRRDCNLLYNYMMKISVLDKIDTFESVELLRDNKTVKIQSGNSLINYLQTTLTFEYTSSTVIIDKPSDSKKFLCLMLTDWLNNFVFSHYEKNRSTEFLILSPILKNQVLFF